MSQTACFTALAHSRVGRPASIQWDRLFSKMRGWAEGAVLGSVPNFCLLAPNSAETGVTVCHSILAPVLSFTCILQTANPFQSHLAYECLRELFPTAKMKLCALFLTKILTLHYTLGFYPFLLTQSSWLLSYSCTIFLLHKALPPLPSIRALTHSILAQTLWLARVFLIKMFNKIQCPR